MHAKRRRFYKGNVLPWGRSTLARLSLSLSLLEILPEISWILLARFRHSLARLGLARSPELPLCACIYQRNDALWPMEAQAPQRPCWTCGKPQNAAAAKPTLYNETPQRDGENRESVAYDMCARALSLITSSGLPPPKSCPLQGVAWLQNYSCF